MESTDCGIVFSITLWYCICNFIYFQSLWNCHAFIRLFLLTLPDVICMYAFWKFLRQLFCRFLFYRIVREIKISPADFTASHQKFLNQSILWQIVQSNCLSKDIRDRDYHLLCSDIISQIYFVNRIIPFFFRFVYPCKTIF